MSSYINVKLRSKVATVLAIGGMVSAVTETWAADPFLEVDGLLVIEAENYHSKANTTQRDWYTFPTSAATPKPDPDGPHSSGAGGGKYVEILPDTRVTHADPFVPGVSFFASGANAPRMNYRIKINNAGRYYVRGRLLSTGLEDNGVHFGINNSWPLSGTSLQQCWPKDQWMWTGSRSYGRQPLR